MRALAVFQGSIDFSEKGYRLFGKSLGTFLKLGRHSVFGNKLLRFDGVNKSLFVHGLIVFYMLIRMMYIYTQ